MTISRFPAIVVTDATLRESCRNGTDGLGARERVSVARALEEAGVDEIETALPIGRAAGADDLAALAAALVQSRPVLWGVLGGRGMAGTIQAARSSGIGAVHLSLSPSAAASDSVLARRVERAVATARDAGLQVSFGIAEATRLDVGTVCALLAAAETAGAHRFRYADTMGVLHPLRTHRLFRDLCAETDLELEFEGHDEFGMATANALAAVQAGATHVSVSCLGRRIASLRGVIAAIHLSPMHHTHVAPARLGALAVLVGSGAREVAPHDERTDLARRCAVASHGGAPSLQLAAE